ncbi:hypothetical protein FJZ27_01310 [Candidatus Peribacteria bacterium]|nr:hypothetical protein [Candidatus Peribacteria bacterium]
MSANSHEHLRATLRSLSTFPDADAALHSLVERWCGDRVADLQLNTVEDCIAALMTAAEHCRIGKMQFSVQQLISARRQHCYGAGHQ